MPDVDFFNFWRWMLSIIGGVYATVITLQSLYGWYVYLAGSDRFISLARRYIIVHGLRLRFTSFWGDVIICVLLTIAFFILWHAHGILFHIEHVTRHGR
jgi:hypothetical protein